MKNKIKFIALVGVLFFSVSSGETDKPLTSAEAKARLEAKEAQVANEIIKRIETEIGQMTLEKVTPVINGDDFGVSDKAFCQAIKSMEQHLKDVASRGFYVTNTETLTERIVSGTNRCGFVIFLDEQAYKNSGLSTKKVVMEWLFWFICGLFIIVTIGSIVNRHN